MENFAAVATIAATAAADNCPPLDRHITVNARYGPRARMVNAGSGYAGRVDDTKVVTAHVRVDAGWEKFSIRADVRTTAVATTATTADASRKRAAPGGDF